MFQKRWFVHSRKERLGIIILMIILFATIVLPLFLPEEPFNKEDISRMQQELDSFHSKLQQAESSIPESTHSQKYLVKENKKDTAFYFNPNQADYSTFLQLGFTPKQIESILRYRDKGGMFFKKEDFKKLYVVSEEKYKRLESYILIPDERVNHKKVVTKEVIEINQADTSKLKQLKGIGSYYASKILAYRKALGGFTHKEQLMEIKGIDSARYNLFANEIIVDTSRLRRININTIKDFELSRHPYIGKYLSKGIITFRDFNKQVHSIDELIDAKILNKEQAEKLKYYFDYCLLKDSIEIQN